MTAAVNLPPAYRLVAVNTVDSTNAEARRLAEQGAEDGTIVWARRQTAGRGRRGRNWESPEGNLHCSLILRPECSVAEAGQLGFVASLAVYDAIGTLAHPGLEAWCKWPNDVILAGGKVAGFLLECESQAAEAPAWVILGIGINVGHYPEDTPYPATSLRAEGSGAVTVEDTLEAVCRHFLTWVNRWLDDGFEPVRTTWRQRAKDLGAPIQVRLDAETLDGTFTDIDENGALVLTQESGVRRISAGEIFPAVAASA